MKIEIPNAADLAREIETSPEHEKAAKDISEAFKAAVRLKLREIDYPKFIPFSLEKELEGLGYKLKYNDFEGERWWTISF